MKQYLRRILSLGLALVLMAALLLPAAAYDLQRSAQPLHVLVGCETQEEAMSCYGLSQEEWDKIQAGYEQFDPQEYFRTEPFHSEYESVEAYLADWDMTQEELDEELVNFWFLDQLDQGYTWVPTQLTQEEEAWLDAHPQQARDFDPAAWFPDSGYADGYHSLAELQQIWELDDTAAAQVMRKDWVSQQLLAQHEQQWEQEFIDAHPQQYAQFDPDRWYVEEYWGAYIYETPEEYIQANGLTREQFVAEMRRDWAIVLMGRESDREWLGEEKVLAGGSRDGINVMVDGRCVAYTETRPVLTDGVVMVPLASTMASMGVQTGWDHMGSATVYRQGVALYLKPGSTQARMVERDGTTTTLELGAAPYFQAGETMVPLAPIAQSLGFLGGWDNEYETLVLVDAASFRDRIAPRFTHMDRVLTAVGDALLPAAQGARELTFSLEMESEGLAFALKGRELTDSAASNVWLELAIDPALLDMLPETGGAPDPRQLEQLELEGIVDRTQGKTYLRGTLFALLEMGLDGESWVVVPSDQELSVGEQMLMLMAAEQLPGDRSVAQQLLDQHFGAWTGFHSYDDMQQALVEMELYADTNWTRAGGSWRLTVSLQDLVAQELGMTAQELTELTPDEWAELEDGYGYGYMPFTLDMTPVGTGCTYRMTGESRDSDGERTSISVSGGPGRLTLELGEDASLFGSFLLRYSVGPADRAPVSAPAAEDTVIPLEELPLDQLPI